MRVLRTAGLAFALAAFALSGCECPETLGELSPQMIIEPSSVHLRNIGVAQDTPIVFTISNPSFVSLNVLDVALVDDESDPAFRLVEEEWPQEVPSTAETTVTVIVRPRVVNTIEAVLRFTGEEDAKPENVVDVPIVVDAVDLGLPEIHVDPPELEFDRVGQGDVVRDTVTVHSQGEIPLIVDEARLVPMDDDEAVYEGPIRLVTQMRGFELQPGSSASLDLVFAPQDTARHEARLRIDSNDPDEDPLFVPIGGAGSVCPVAVAKLLEDPLTIEPLDTVRFDGHDSFSPETERSVVAWEWTLTQRPIGATSVLSADDAERVELTTEIAGTYEVALHVRDDTGVRSCDPSIVTILVQPKEALHVELVWDHPTADLDLHMVREGGLLFNHDGDVYFSNREPVQSEQTPGWSAVPEENPTLDVDDDQGYGPENADIVDPAGGSNWNVYVHYWRKNTDGDPFTTATLRVYVYGALEAELSQTFDADETMWHALEIAWPEVELAPAVLTPRNSLQPYVRPF